MEAAGCWVLTICHITTLPKYISWVTVIYKYGSNASRWRWKWCDFLNNRAFYVLYMRISEFESILDVYLTWNITQASCSQWLYSINTNIQCIGIEHNNNNIYLKQTIHTLPPGLQKIRIITRVLILVQSAKRVHLIDSNQNDWLNCISPLVELHLIIIIHTNRKIIMFFFAIDYSEYIFGICLQRKRAKKSKWNLLQFVQLNTFVITAATGLNLWKLGWMLILSNSSHISYEFLIFFCRISFFTHLS